MVPTQQCTFDGCDGSCSICATPVASPCGCAATLAAYERLVQERDAALDDAEFATTTLAALIAYVDWRDVPDGLADDIDAALDGNVA